MIKREPCIAVNANTVETKTHIDNAIRFTIGEPGMYALKQHNVAPIFSVRAYHEMNLGVKSEYLHLLQKNVETLFRCAMLSFDPKTAPQSYTPVAFEVGEENAVYGCIYPEPEAPDAATPRDLSDRWEQAGFDTNRELRVSINYLSRSESSLTFRDFQQVRGNVVIIDPCNMITGGEAMDGVLSRTFPSQQLTRFQENFTSRLESLGCTPFYYAAVSSAQSKRAFQVMCFRLQENPDFVYEMVLDAYALKLLVLRNALGCIPE